MESKFIEVYGVQIFALGEDISNDSIYDTKSRVIESDEIPIGYSICIIET